MPTAVTPLYLAIFCVIFSGCGDVIGGVGVWPGPDSNSQDGVAETVSDAVIADVQQDVATDAPKGDVPPKDMSSSDSAVGSLSCQGKCKHDFKPGQPCQCNDLCEKYGNCCKDWVALCKPKKDSCVSRCGQSPGKDLTCGCQWNCGKAGSCCADYLGACHGKADLDWLVADKQECASQSSWFGVKLTKDGDTIVLTNGSIVRFLLINAPELSSADCYAQHASNFTYNPLRKAGIVCLVKDPNQPDKDQYDRLLRYVYYKAPDAGGKTVQLNARLVRLGLGTVFYPYAKGNVHETISVLMQQKARVGKVGGWSQCGW